MEEIVKMPDERRGMIERFGLSTGTPGARRAAS